MKLKENFFYTYKEEVKNEESISGKLLVRSGMVKKAGSGIYIYHPLAYRVIRKIENVVREEMDNAGAVELIMPSLLPEDYYVKTKRVEAFGKDLFRLRDRFQRNYLLGPTHEELFAVSAKEVIKSYKDLPFNIYQIARKYRDEPRPRYGLIRIREFFMKDAYSFDRDLAGLDDSYQKMYQAYCNVFDRMGLDYKIVTSDTGAMCGILSEEYQAISEIGEDTIVLCNSCDFASNIDICVCLDSESEKETEEAIEKIHTPNAATIEEVTNMMNLPATRFVKTMIYNIDNQFYACLVKGDRDVNETKVLRLLGASEMELATSGDVERITNSIVGYAGPVNLEIRVIVDSEVLQMTNFVTGANESEYHLKNTNIKDFEVFKSGDIKNIQAGDKCPKCGQTVYFKKGIEVGNLFKLGDKYSKDLDVTYADENNHLQYPIMGSYGIGLERTMVSVIEQSHDEKGIIWPMNIAPFQVALVLIDSNDEAQIKVADKIYQELLDHKVEVIYDNRDERPGVKFNDMDLIGIPIRVTVGKKIANKVVEIKLRTENESRDIEILQLVTEIKKIIGN